VGQESKKERCKRYSALSQAYSAIKTMQKMSNGFTLKSEKLSGEYNNPKFQ
jgi:hypothetical protein